MCGLVPPHLMHGSTTTLVAIRLRMMTFHLLLGTTLRRFLSEVDTQGCGWGTTTLLGPHSRETEEEINGDHYPRADAFDKSNRQSPLQGAVKRWPARSGYTGPHLQSVIETYNTSAGSAALTETRWRYSWVRYPTGLHRFPGARALVYPRPTF
ncbi:hypothetical protein Emed_003665 [Eimeria media]